MPLVTLLAQPVISQSARASRPVVTEPKSQSLQEPQQVQLELEQEAAARKAVQHSKERQKDKQGTTRRMSMLADEHASLKVAFAARLKTMEDLKAESNARIKELEEEVERLKQG